MSQNLGSLSLLSHNVTLRRPPPPPLNVWRNLWIPLTPKLYLKVVPIYCFWWWVSRCKRRMLDLIFPRFLKSRESIRCKAFSKHAGLLCNASWFYPSYVTIKIMRVAIKYVYTVLLNQLLGKLSVGLLVFITIFPQRDLCVINLHKCKFGTNWAVQANMKVKYMFGIHSRLNYMFRISPVSI